MRTEVIPENIYHQLASAYLSNGKYTDGFPDAALKIIRREKLFKLFLPESLGGLGMNLQETLNVIQRCAYINGSVGWLIQIGNGGNYFAAFVDEKTSQELFSPENAVLAGSGAATGVAIPTEGGYNVTGSWKYASGSAYASFFTFSAKVQGSDQVISGCLMPEQVKVIDDWKTIGMRFTTTNTFTADNQFVPSRFVFNLSDQKSYKDISVFSFPFLAYAQAFFLSVQYGLLSRILHEASAMLAKNEERWKLQHPNRGETIRKSVVSGMQLCLRFHEELKACITTTEGASGTNRDELVTHLDAVAKQQNREMLQAAQQIFSLLGMGVLYEEHPINIAYRDMMVCGQHSLLNTY